MADTPQSMPAAAPNTEYPQRSKPYIPAKRVNTEYPLIDSDPHFRRVLGYMRTSDYVHGTVGAAVGPAAFLIAERVSPSGVGRGGFAGPMRLMCSLGLSFGFFLAYSRSINRFYGFTENRREIELDMREMVDKVKRGEPLYGTSQLTEYMQGVSSRQSRYAATFIHVMPWFNFVNHNQHGVDTAKYYQQAERELDAGREG